MAGPAGCGDGVRTTARQLLDAHLLEFAVFLQLHWGDGLGGGRSFSFHDIKGQIHQPASLLFRQP